MQVKPATKSPNNSDQKVRKKVAILITSSALEIKIMKTLFFDAALNEMQK